MKRIERVGSGAGRMFFAATAAACLLGPPSLLSAPVEEARANRPSSPKPKSGEQDPLTWVEAVLQTQTTGRPSVLVITSKAIPRPFDQVKTLMASPAVGKLLEKINVAELTAEQEPEQVARLQVKTFPTYLAFRRNPAGAMETVATYRGSMGPEEFSGWVRGSGLISDNAEAPARADATVSRVGLFDRNPPMASPQQIEMPAPTVVYQAAPSPKVLCKPAPTVRREVLVERPKVERRYIRETVPETRVVRSYKLVPYDREITVNRQVAREVIVERDPAPSTPRVVGDPGNILTRPSPQVERDLIGPRGTPQEAVMERELPREREVIVERAAPSRLQVEDADDSGLNLIPPCFLGRGLGVIGDKLRYFSLPRVDVTVETRKVYRSWPTHKKVQYVTEQAPRYVTEPAPREVYVQPAPQSVSSPAPSSQQP